MAYNPLAFGLMLVSLGTFVMAGYIYRKYLHKAQPPEEKSFGMILMVIALVAGIFGFNLYFAEPIPGQYIEIYAVGYLIYAILLMVGGATIHFNWDKRPASYLAGVGGIILLNSAYTVFHFYMSKSPIATAALFALSGIGSLGSLGVTHLKDVEENKWAMMVGVAIFVLIGVLALYSGMGAQFGHVERALSG